MHINKDILFARGGINDVNAYDTDTGERVPNPDYRGGFIFDQAAGLPATFSPTRSFLVDDLEAWFLVNASAGTDYLYTYTRSRPAKAEATRATNGTISSFKLTDRGFGYDAVPSITVDRPASAWATGKVIDDTGLGTESADTSWDLDDEVTWFPQAWSDEKGYPTVFAFHQSRLMTGGTKTIPDKVFGSVIGDYFNFDDGINANDGFTIDVPVASQIDIVHITSKGNRLLLFTDSETKVIASPPGTSIGPLTGTIDGRNQEGVAAHLQPIDYRENLLYIDSSNTNLYLTQFSENLREYTVRKLNNTPCLLYTSPSPRDS